jgi:hypothetical protein
MRRSSFIVSESDVPPLNHQLGRHTKCGWCASVIGEEHKPECVRRKRSVVVRIEVEMVTTIPEHWDVETLEFIYNGNKFCASNFIDWLKEREACICGGLSYVREADDRDEKLLPWGSEWRA